MESQISELRVKLEDFYGPIDLMLELARERELDITELTVSIAIDQYIALLKGLKELRIDVAADFIYFASQLLLVKSRNIIPYVGEDEEAQEEDAASDLVRKLLEYKRFRSGMEWIGQRYDEALRSHRGPHFVSAGEDEKEEVDLQSLTLYAVVSTYARIKYSTEFAQPMQIIYSEIPVENYIKMIIQSLARTGSISLAEFFKPMSVHDTVGNMLALLELIRREEVELNTVDEPVLKLRTTGQSPAQSNQGLAK